MLVFWDIVSFLVPVRQILPQSDPSLF
jgi:hypothetical protein